MRNPNTFDVIPSSLAISFILVCVACASSNTLQKCEMQEHKISFEDMERTYYVYTPETYCKNPTKKYPLTFYLHCFGGSPQHYFQRATSGNAPTVPMILPAGIQNSWNAETCCGTALGKNINDVGFLDKLMEEVPKIYSYFYTHAERGARMSGFSNGGYLATYYSIQGKYPLSKIAPASGHVYDLENLKSAAIVDYRGKHDTNVRPDGCCSSSNCCCGIKYEKCVTMREAFDKWAAINKCSDMKTLTTEDRTCFHGKNCAAATTFCLLDNEGHFTPPLEPLLEFFDSDTEGENASEINAEESQTTTFATFGYVMLFICLNYTAYQTFMFMDDQTKEKYSTIVNNGLEASDDENELLQ